MGHFIEESFQAIDHIATDNQTHIDQLDLRESTQNPTWRNLNLGQTYPLKKNTQKQQKSLSQQVLDHS